MVAYFGGFLLPITGMGMAFGSFVWQSSGSPQWGAVTAVGFILVNVLGVGAIYGSFSKRMDNFEASLPLLIQNSVLKLKEELRDVYQTKDGCKDIHTGTRSKGAGA